MSAPEPMAGLNPPTAWPPTGARARLRARLAVLRRRGRVLAGDGVAVGPGVVWDVAPGARVVLADGCAIAQGTRFHVTGGELRLGPRCVVGDRCVFRIAAGAELGARCRLGDEAVLLDTAPLPVVGPDGLVRNAAPEPAPIVLGDDVRIGSRAVVHGGVRVGDGAQIGAWLVVTEDVPAGGRVHAPAPEVGTAAAPTRKPEPPGPA